VPLSVRWRYKINHWRTAIANLFHKEQTVPRPRLCAACGALVGATSNKCHQCGASQTFSMAAASRGVGRLMPQSSPVTYGVLGLCGLLYGASLLATMKRSGFAAPTGGLGALFGLGGIDTTILVRMGASLPLQFLLRQPWRLITAIFLHGSLLHLGFNLWVLMDLGPTVEELYGSARFFFIFVVTGAFGYLASSAMGHLSVGASGSLLGMVGVLLALTVGSQNIGMRMLRSQLINWLVYIAVLGLLMPGIDNWAHGGGFAAGFVLGRLMPGRKPADAAELNLAQALGWAAGFAVAASFGFMVLNYFSSALGQG
jgi:rhomboid protease GluP